MVLSPRGPRRGPAALIALAFALASLAGCVTNTRDRGESAQCTFNGDCNDPLVCAGSFCRAQCASDRDCPVGQCSPSDDPTKRVCLPWGAAALCSSNTDCPEGSGCNVADHECHPRCNSSSDCGEGGTCDTTSHLCSDAVRIGVPRPSMDAGTDVVDAMDVRDVSDVVSCDADTQSDPLNCGRCGHPCTAGAHSAAVCTAGTCALNCAPGYADCDHSAANGCEANLATDTAHCGACTFACPGGANATTTCAAGRCGYTCNTGFRDCDDNMVDGCESDSASDNANCGACANTCTSTQMCMTGECTDVGACSPDITTDPRNCGACFHRCPVYPNATAACAAGNCTTACDAGYTNCDGDLTNGCEAHTYDDNANCGTCGNTCSGGSYCVAGRCVQDPYLSDGHEGDFAPTADTVLPAGQHYFRSVTIPMGVTVRTNGDGVLEIFASGPVQIDGAIDVSGGAGATGAGCNSGGGSTGTGVAGGARAGSPTVCAPRGLGGRGAVGGDSAHSASVPCGVGGAYGGGEGAGGGCNLFGGGGGGGYAGGGGATYTLRSLCGGYTFMGGAGGSFGGDQGGAAGQGGEPTAPAPYAGGTGSAQGGGSIGMSAVNDLPVASTFRPGSGGGGGTGFNDQNYACSGGGGGGGGGGAVRIYSAVSITIGSMGAVRANGGSGGSSGGFTASGGGGGSGGVVYLSSRQISVAGSVSARGGLGDGVGGMGRIRLSADPAHCTLNGPFEPLLDNYCTPTAAPGVLGRTFVGLYPD